MKIGKQLRNLILRQTSTYVIRPGSCEYMGETYEYPLLTMGEREEMVLGLLKLVDKRSWIDYIANLLTPKRKKK